MRIRTALSAAVLAATVLVTPAALAQESSYTFGTVWEVSGIDVKPGQLENYMDYLAGAWKKTQEFAKKEGWVVSYRVFQVNQPRAGEPDLFLAIEYKDYATTAQKLEFQKELEEHMREDSRAMDKSFGEREAMRSVTSNMEMQELKLK
jgi:hypothetical protein